QIQFLLETYPAASNRTRVLLPAAVAYPHPSTGASYEIRPMPFPAVVASCPTFCSSLLPSDEATVIRSSPSPQAYSSAPAFHPLPDVLAVDPW
ncbi:unnamed protein product, partial [Urochloa humidicola]